MYQQDYILRQIEMMGVLMRRMLDAILNREPDEAQAMIEETLEELGAGPDLADSLPAEGLLAVFSAGGGLDAPRVALLGRALVARAEVFAAKGRAEESARDRAKGEALIAAAAPGLDAATREALDALPSGLR